MSWIGSPVHVRGCRSDSPFRRGRLRGVYAVYYSPDRPGWTCSSGENWWHAGNSGVSSDLAQMNHSDYRCGSCDKHASCGLALEATRELDESLNDPAAIKDVLERYPAHLALDVAAGGIAIYDCAGSKVDFASMPVADLARVVALNS